MTDDEKIKVIESMGINWNLLCPYDIEYKLKANCENGDTNRVCKKYWIKALEE